MDIFLFGFSLLSLIAAFLAFWIDEDNTQTAARLMTEWAIGMALLAIFWKL